jgi:hypothetical protein
MNDDKVQPRSAWVREGDCALLREACREPVVLNEQSLRAAWAHVKAHRTAYATEEAWQLQLDKYKEGLACLGLLP